MISPTLRDEMLKEFDSLSPAFQQRVLGYVEGLIAATSNGTPGHALAQLSGILPEESAREMLAAIEESCEQVDFDEW